MNDIPEHQSNIPSGEDFASTRESWRRATAHDDELRSLAVAYQVACSKHQYTYQFEWLGVPIIRLPDDIVILQELIWSLKPSKIIETGIARGGSLILSASLMDMVSGNSDVLGLDIQILPHTQKSILESKFASSIKMWEGSSASKEAIETVKNFIGTDTSPCLLVLDSDHTHDHVLSELNALAPLFPKNSVIMVADTLIEELPDDFYSNRDWAVGNNPLTALNEFLQKNAKLYEREFLWGRRAVQSEFRDGIIRKLT